MEADVIYLDTDDALVLDPRAAEAALLEIRETQRSAELLTFPPSEPHN